MVTALRVAIADKDQQRREYLERCLPAFGFEIVASAPTGQELVEACLQEKPDVVVTDLLMPDLDGIDAAQAVNEAWPVAVVLLSTTTDGDVVERARNSRVQACLTNPVRVSDLATTIPIAYERFNECLQLERDSHELRVALENRKVIERAKGILMKWAGIEEDEAFRRLRKLARDGNQKLACMAAKIVEVNGDGSKMFEGQRR